jgi:hypothetical protein
VTRRVLVAEEAVTQKMWWVLMVVKLDVVSPFETVRGISYESVWRGSSTNFCETASDVPEARSSTLTVQSGCHVKNGCEHPGYSYPAEDAGIALVGEVELEEAVVDNAKCDQDKASADYFPVDLAFCLAFFLLAGKREWESDACNEQEQGKDGVVMHNPGPVGVAHLGCQTIGKAAVRKVGTDGGDQAGEAHDEAHVETSEGVYRIKSLLHNEGLLLSIKR